MYGISWCHMIINVSWCFFIMYYDICVFPCSLYFTVSVLNPMYHQFITLYHAWLYTWLSFLLQHDPALLYTHTTHYMHLFELTSLIPCSLMILPVCTSLCLHCIILHHYGATYLYPQGLYISPHMCTSWSYLSIPYFIMALFMHHCMP